MCRFLVYKGSDEILLSKLILDPSHSILTQSFDSRLRLDTRRPHNGDGFGIGYYTDIKLGPEPCIFTSIIPAWNCVNLQRIASKTASPLIFAHVRATTEGSLSDDNCHPFCHGSLMWMHNGGLGGWKHIKRSLGAKLADKWYLGVRGGTDSEWAFALFLDTLDRMGYDPSSPPPEGFGPNVIRKAVLKTIAHINELIAKIPESILQSESVDTRSLLNFAVTDGHSVVCTRYVSSTTDEAASLYYSSGTTWDDKKKGNFQMDRRDKGADIVLVASEPLTFERDNWVTVPTNSTITIHKQTVMVHPIIDEYYSHNPYHSRSSKYVVEKGLISNEKPSTARGGSLSPAITPNLDDVKTQLGPSKLQESMSRSATPDTISYVPDYRSTSQKESTKSTQSDVRSLSSLSARDPSKPQEQGNTKKKRTSLLDFEMPATNAQVNTQPEPTNFALDERRTSYGDPMKLAKYFPELNLS